jgi:hypothetical protein
MRLLHSVVTVVSYCIFVLQVAGKPSDRHFTGSKSHPGWHVAERAAGEAPFWYALTTLERQYRVL